MSGSVSQGDIDDTNISVNFKEPLLNPLLVHSVPLNFLNHKHNNSTKSYYNPFLVYCRELAPGIVSLTVDRAQGDDNKHDSHYTQSSTNTITALKVSQSCADLESFCQRGSNIRKRFILFYFSVEEGREDPNTTISGSSSARQRNAILMAFCWRADDGPTLKLAW